jgi:hypothetical protein
MTLGEKQEKFSKMVMLLLIHIHALGYSVRGGHWFRCDDCYVGAKNSVHKLKLALDINLSISPAHGERPRYLTGRDAERAHNLIHNYWDSIGGAPRIKNDLNHYSVMHNGRW